MVIKIIWACELSGPMEFLWLSITLSKHSRLIKSPVSSSNNSQPPKFHHSLIPVRLNRFLLCAMLYLIVRATKSEKLLRTECSSVKMLLGHLLVNSLSTILFILRLGKAHKSFLSELQNSFQKNIISTLFLFRTHQHESEH